MTNHQWPMDEKRDDSEPEIHDGSTRDYGCGLAFIVFGGIFIWVIWKLAVFLEPVLNPWHP